MSISLERIEQFEKMISGVDTFIECVMDFLYTEIEDPNYAEIIECTKAIVSNNHKVLLSETEEIQRIKRSISDAKPIVAEDLISPTLSQPKVKNRKEQKDLSEIIELLKANFLESDSERYFIQLTREELIYLKLYFYKEILKCKKEIKCIILNDPTSNITNIQKQINEYELIIEFLKELEKSKDSDLIADETEIVYSNIVFAPDNKNSTFILNDITETSTDKLKEIKLIIDKIIDGYFLKTKDTKSIEGYKEKIYEYTHPNGIRILYFVMGNIIIVTSLFFKDKQKSSKITNEYEEGIKRFYETKDYIERNFTNPDFHIEQAELIGKLFAYLDNYTLSKKVGE